MTTSSCVNGVCGTGKGNYPQPGDPDNNITITATPAFGGIDVAWTYPGMNPEAVAHVILYRGVSDKFENAARLTIVNGTFFYDKSAGDHDIQYFYWVQVVSVNGTYGDVIGPATAVASPTLAEMLVLLAGQIDAGMLSQTLKQEIDKIKLNKLGIDKALLEQAAVDQALAAAFNQVEATSEQTRAMVQQEMVARAKADSAVITQVNTIYTDMDGRMSAVQRVQDVLVSEMKSVAQDITSVSAELNGNSATGEIGLTTTVEKLSDTVTEIGSLYTVKVQVDKNGQKLIGGFGIYNDGKTVQAGFDVDTFWVGKTGVNGRKPFIIKTVNNKPTVFMDEAAIFSLTFNKLRSEDGKVMVKEGKLMADYLELNLAKVSGALQSSNYSPNTRGFKLDVATGTFENNGSGVGGRMSQTNRAIKIWDENSVKRVQLGDLNA